MLTGWFKANQNIELARQYTYQEFPNTLYGRPRRRLGRSEREHSALAACILLLLHLGSAFTCGPF
jgi:hypothetical protein